MTSQVYADEIIQCATLRIAENVTNQTTEHNGVLTDLVAMGKHVNDLLPKEKYPGPILRKRLAYVIELEHALRELCRLLDEFPTRYFQYGNTQDA